MSEQSLQINLKKIKRQKVKDILERHSKTKYTEKEIIYYTVIKDELEV